MESELQRAITQLRDRSPGSSHSTRSYIDLSFEGRMLQLRSDQLTVSNIARTFRLIPETIILISESGTVAIPDGENGVFPDLDSSLMWVVEGDKSGSVNPDHPFRQVLLEATLHLRNDGSRTRFHALLAVPTHLLLRGR